MVHKMSKETIAIIGALAIRERELAKDIAKNKIRGEDLGRIPIIIKDRYYKLGQKDATFAIRMFLTKR